MQSAYTRSLSGFSFKPFLKKTGLICAVSTLILAASGVARAETEANGLAYHGFVYSPSIDIKTQYTDNLFSSKENKTSDYIAVISPEITIDKAYEALNMNLKAQVDDYRYLENSGENRTEYNGLLQGGYELNSKWSIPFSASLRRQYRNRGTPTGQERSDERLSTDTIASSLGIARRFNRLSISLIGAYEGLSFEDGRATATNAPVIHSDGNRHIYKGTLSFKYDFLRSSGKTPDYVLFTDISHAEQRYEKNEYIDGQGFSGAKKDRSVKSILSGFDMNYKNLIMGRFALGYSQQDYDDGAADNQDTLITDIDLSYFLSKKHTLGFGWKRQLNADRIVQSDYELSSAYEIYHSLKLNSSAAYKVYEFTDEFADNNREDKETQLNIGLMYDLNKNWDAGINLGYTTKDSTDAEDEFDRYVIGLQFKGKL